MFILDLPTFLEIIFTLLPWKDVRDLDDIPSALFLAFDPVRSARDAQVIHLLSPRHLPQKNPRWSEEAKLVFNGFLDTVLDEVGFLQTTWFYIHRLDF